MNPQGFLLTLLTTVPYLFQIPNTGNRDQPFTVGIHNPTPSCQASSTTGERNEDFIPAYWPA